MPRKERHLTVAATELVRKTGNASALYTHMLRDAVDWIAWNDAPGDDDATLPRKQRIARLRGTLTIALVADVFCETQDAIAGLVIDLRDANDAKGETNG